MNIFKYLPANFACSRKARGGKWELWIVGDQCNQAWFKVEDWSRVTGVRPLLCCHGTCVEESY